jgi:dTDP-4-amino-4,6-dideoxygalactose transaminase
MIQLSDFEKPFDAILAFESQIAAWTGAPYCVTTDCCTHAIEIALRLTQPVSVLQFSAYTYLSVPMTMHKLGISYELIDQPWTGCYQFLGSHIWDCARRFERNMYEQGQIQCLSFGRTKPLQIGLGGCILTDDADLYRRASRMRYDGRDIFVESPWHTQSEFEIGFHYYLRPEECVMGLNLLQNQQFIPQIEKHYSYPDCRQIKIK